MGQFLRDSVSRFEPVGGAAGRSAGPGHNIWIDGRDQYGPRGDHHGRRVFGLRDAKRLYEVVWAERRRIRLLFYRSARMRDKLIEFFACGTAGDRCKFFDIARGSGLECAGCLDLLFIKKLISETELDQGKSLLRDVVSLLVGLIRSNSPDRLHEDGVVYRMGEGD